jgi:hypothetical protein
MGACRTGVVMAVMVASVVGGPHQASAGETTSGRVRPGNAAIAALVHQAGEASPTFRRLVERIDAGDGLVVIREGRCKHGRRACLVTVTMAGTTRVLWITLDTRDTAPVLMGLIGHELQHALEVLAEPGVTTAIAMFAFYNRAADTQRGGPVFETQAAITAGETVLAEVRRQTRLASRRTASGEF